MPGPALLFCPADRPDRYAKALAAADGVILDLEDGVGAGGKDAARAALVATDLDPARVIVRVNATGTPEHAADMTALRGTGYRRIMLPKAETRAQLDRLLDPDNESVTLATLTRAAQAVGRQLRMELV